MQIKLLLRMGNWYCFYIIPTDYILWEMQDKKINVISGNSKYSGRPYPPAPVKPVHRDKCHFP